MDTPLIPRQAIFGNADRASPQISPDGQRLSWLAPHEGVMNLWVARVDDLDAARPISHEKGRGLRDYAWAFDGEHILYVQDTGGDENWHLFAARLDGSGTRDLTDLDGIQAQVLGRSRNHPHHVLVGINDRVPQLHDVYKVDLRTGEREKVVENPGFVGFVADADLNVVVAATMGPDGGVLVFQRVGEDWQPLLQAGSEDSLTTSPIAMDATGRVLFLIDSRGRDTAGAFALSLDTGEQTLLAEDPRADVSDLIVHPTERRVQAVASTWQRTTWQILDDDIRPDLEALETEAGGGEVSVLSRSDDDQTWTVALVGDEGPVRYGLWNRTTKTWTFLFMSRSALEGRTLARMLPRVIESRDGLSLVSYLSLPPGSDDDGDGVPDAPLPLVLLVHGGPWARDSWGYDPLHQWLANRGYAVLAVNFRGSTGFGKAFVNAGDKAWAAEMHDDLIDAVQWAIAQGITTSDKVAIAGGSYGGYATLVGLTFTPDVFACGVDIVGPSNIQTLIESIPEYWKPMVAQFHNRVGNPTTEEGQAFLWSRSPLSRVDRITRPLLIGQGANDPRVKQAESDQIVGAMQEHGIPVTYVLFPDEGHGFARPENSMAFWGIMEAFLASHLGGRVEPLGDQVKDSTAQVPAGADQIPGLSESLP